MFYFYKPLFDFTFELIFPFEHEHIHVFSIIIIQMGLEPLSPTDWQMLLRFLLQDRFP
jgi:hypothetical protein